MTGMEDTVVPIVIVGIVIGLPIVAWIISRVLAHRERIEMIRHGLLPPPDPGVPRPSGTRWHQGRPSAWDAESAHESLRRGVKTTMLGLALLIGVSFIGYRTTGPLGVPTIDPGPWLLVGLIPTFIGLAQIMVALLSGARFGPPQGAPPPSAAPPTGAPPPPSTPPMRPIDRS
jgi:hypothetical protein